MRHRHGLRKLNRTSEHRLAMLRNMAVSLLQHEAIKTTLPKAKELRRVVEPMITLGKDRRSPTGAWRSTACATATSSRKLFDELGPRYKARPGGYTRILKMGFRSRRQRADGVRRAGRPARAGRRPKEASNSPSQQRVSVS